MYLHRISDNRLSSSALNNMGMFASMCGQRPMPNVVLVTTMWGGVRGANKARREQELRNHFWKDMLADGCRTLRFEDTFESAWAITDSIVESSFCPDLDIQRELVDENKSLDKTTAGSHGWELWRRRHSRVLSR